MIDYLISLFIDDEMDLDEKVSFVESVRSDDHFAMETLSLLAQEKVLRGDVAEFVPPVILPEMRSDRSSLWRRMMISIGTGAAAVGIAFMLVFSGLWMDKDTGTFDRIPYRFVIYHPDARKAEIVGSFTDWKALPMNHVDDYWQITLDLPVGEHRFSYILDGHRQVSDPTIPIREKDDFGGENSILEVQWSV